MMIIEGKKNKSEIKSGGGVKDGFICKFTCQGKVKVYRKGTGDQQIFLSLYAEP
jgi:hypothetical protein